MKKILKNQRGIALLMVLSTIAVLSIAVVEFAYEEEVNYRMAVHQKQRLQAFYLAKSALNISKLILIHNKEAEKQLEKSGMSAQSLGVQPLYRMFPISSYLLRELLSGGGLTSMLGGGEEATEEVEGEAETAEEKAPAEDATAPDESASDMESSMESGLGMLAKDELEKFLSFDGNFASEITEEQTKYDVNMVYGLETKSKTFDARKRALESILRLPIFKDVFENQEKEVEPLVHAIADWVDANNTINEYDNVQKGGENGAYGEQKYKVRNGKFLSLSELRLVDGMNDKIHAALTPLVTTYNTSEKINVCLAGEDVLRALIFNYANYAGCGVPIKYEDDEKLTQLVTDVMAKCPDVDQMAVTLNTALGLADLGGEEVAESVPETVTETSADEPSEDVAERKSVKSKGVPGSTVAGCTFQFRDFLTKDNNVFTIKASGVLDENTDDEELPTTVTLTTVINVENKDPQKWQTYYYRIE